MANFGYLFWKIPESNLLISLFIIISYPYVKTYQKIGMGIFYIGK